MARREPVSQQHSTIQKSIDWLLKYWPLFATGIAALTAVGLALIGWMILGVGSQLATIQDHTTKLAKLESLPEDFRELRNETRSALATTDNRVIEVTRKLASLETLPDRVSASNADIAGIRSTTAQSAKETKEAMADLSDVPKDIKAIKVALEQQQGQIDFLKPLPTAIADARAALDAIKLGGAGRVTATVRVQLKEGMAAEETGKFQRQVVEVELAEIPLLADNDSVATLTITSAEFESSKFPEYALRITVQPRLNRVERKLSLILWLAKNDKYPSPLAECYARLSVSWVDGP